MFLLCILIGWIFGISTMGKFIPESFISSAPIFYIFSFVFIVLHFFKKRIIQPFFFKCIFAFSLTMSGFFIGQVYADHALNQRLQLRITNVQETSAIVYIDSIGQLSSDGGTNLRTKQKAFILHPNAQTIYWMLYSKEQAEQNHFQIGHYYRVSGTVKPAHGYAVDGAFDQERWFLQENIMASMQVQSIQAVTDAEIQQLGYASFIKAQQGFIPKLKRYVEQKRLDFRGFIQQQPLTQKGLILALLTGDESLLSQETQTLFKRLGISHLLAISGPHVLIFAVLFCFFITQLVQRVYPQIYLKIPRPYFILIPFLLCVWLYTAFVGFEIPAMRTFLTVCLMTIILLLRQSVNALSLLLLSASLLLWVDPFSILSAAFWLSYGACFILIRVYQTIQQQSDDAVQTWQDKVKLFLKVLVESQWKVFIALFPLVILIFQQVSWLSPFANLIAIPLIGVVIVPLEVIGACLSLCIEPLGLIFFHLADWALQFLLSILIFLDQGLNAKLSWIAITPWALVCLTLGVLILFLPQSVLPKAWAVVCLFPILVTAKSQSEFELTVLDVGQGQSLFLNLPKQKILIDTGGYYDESKFSMGEKVVIPYLMKQGISHLDKVILSHLDQDHSGAFASIQKEIKIQDVYSNEKDQRFDVSNFHYCYAGQKWQFDQIKVEILSPSENMLSQVKNNQNELSCIVYIQVPQSNSYQNFLIMGDAGWETEYQLLQQYPDLKVDVLILGHHGSQHSSSYAFLKRLASKLTIASAGFNNRYGHPHPIVSARLDALTIPMQTTIQQGSIAFQLQRNGQMKIQHFRETKKWLQTQN